MTKTVYEVYELYTETKKTTKALTADEAKAALESVFMDNEKPRRTFDDREAAAAFVTDQGTGRIDDFGSYWRIHGWIVYEVDQTIEDGEVTDRMSIGTTTVSEF